ncbi:hypothetical protein BCR39DRAFT_518886 [Naematelia encephala]|uniref:Uncharacterized protein n=1 Tax=Naematelia encephala TaxID=71784 RepID=A0A1Y2BG83_9TREE|nr:hypothetical protein BCR39DRAFT_518886 [Naematelia encephala]
MSMFRLRPVLRQVTVRPVVSRAGMSSVHGNDPDKIAKEKARNLSGTQDSSAPHKEHAPGWNEHLASDSEAAIKADQAAPDGKPGKELQDTTVAHTHKHHHTDAGNHGAESHAAKHAPVEPTHSEDAVKADRGDH